MTASAGRAAAAGDSARVEGARAHYEQAVGHYNLDEYAPALAEFREAYRLKPDPSFLFNIAQCYRKLGDREAALDFFRKYLRSVPNAPNRSDVQRFMAELRAHAPEAATPAPAGRAPDANAAAVEATPPPPPSVLPPSVLPASAPAVLAPPSTPVTAPALFVVEAPPPVRAPFYEKWWFWTAIGVVAAAAVVTGFALSDDAKPYGGTLGPGVVQLRLR